MRQAAFLCRLLAPPTYPPFTFTYYLCRGNNRLEGMRDAVRRGRMLRCKTCGE